MYVCKYVCMYVFIYVCIHECVYVCVCVCLLSSFELWLLLCSFDEVDAYCV